MSVRVTSLRFTLRALLSARLCDDRDRVEAAGLAGPPDVGVLRCINPAGARQGV
jgi:hypothetical protein